MKIKELIEIGKNNLIENDEPYKICRVLLKNILNVDNMYIMCNNADLKDEIVEKFNNSIKLLNSGIPLQYITNKQEFMKLNFYVDENVLIPQPDTEILVEEIIEMYKNKTESIKVLDLCTGSGAIGVSIAKYIKNSKVTMLDISEKALKIAEKNSKINYVEDKCSFVLSDMFNNITDKFDIIVSNPPYIKTNVISQLSKEVRKEPTIALDGGVDGLFFYKKIVENAYKYLSNDGILALEIGYDQKEEVIDLLEKENKYFNIYSKKDLSQNDRIVVCTIKKGE